MVNNSREDTGYEPIARCKKRVDISRFGEKAKSDIARKEIKALIDQLKIDCKAK